MNLILLTLIANPFSVKEWEAIPDWCADPAFDHLHLHVLSTEPDFEHSGIVHNLQRDCGGKLTTHISIEPDDLPSHRIARLALLRDTQREAVVKQRQEEDHRLLLDNNDAVGDDADSSDVVVVFDMDAHKLPAASELRNAVSQVAVEKNVDVLCANGYETLEGGFRRYYDTFALVYDDGTSAFPKTKRKAFLHDLTFFLFWLYRSIVTWPSSMYPVRSCFGGAAVYNADLWLDTPQCSYQYSTPGLLRTLGHSDLGVCEHVAFHECLHQEHPTLRVAIQPHFMYERNRLDVDHNGYRTVIWYILVFCAATILRCFGFSPRKIVVDAWPRLHQKNV